MINNEMQNENHTIVETLRKSRLAAAGCVLCLGLLLTGCGKAEPSEQNQNDNINESIVQDDTSVQIEIDESDNSDENSEGTQESEVDDPVEIPFYSTMEEVNALNLPENMLAFYLVLTNKKPFISADVGCQEFYLDEFCWCSNGTDKYKVNEVMVVDMDRNGEEEIVLGSKMPPGDRLVLDYQDGKVYGYLFIYNGMGIILPNGVYDSIAGAAVGWHYRITEFDKGTYKQETLTYMDHGYYEIKGHAVTYDEFYDYIRIYTEAESVQSWDYEEEVLERLFLEGLTEEEVFVARHAPKEELAVELPDISKVPSECIQVLTEGKKFICVTNDNKKFYLEGNILKSRSEDREWEVNYFSIVDMDGDGISEIVLTGYHDRTLVLHGTENGVRGYLFDFDDVGAISKNGIFALDLYCGEYDTCGKILSFGEDGCEMKWFDAVDGPTADRIVYYTFSEEMIEKVFAGE